jgi:hypothetical protein
MALPERPNRAMLLLRPATRGPLISLLLATTIPIILFGVGAAYLAAARTRSGAEQLPLRPSPMWLSV